MKQSIILTIFLLLMCLGYGQNHENVDLLETDSTWSKEIFHFPIGFAQDIKHEGVEDVRFPPGWAKKESDEFWSYVFVWHIKPQAEINEQELAGNLETYFDGLMAGRIKENESEPLNTTVLFLKKGETNKATQYVGKIKTIDGFFTKKPMTLYVEVESTYCEISKKAVVLFRFSPKAFEHKIWQKLGEVKPKYNICDF